MADRALSTELVSPPVEHRGLFSLLWHLIKSGLWLFVLPLVMVWRLVRAVVGRVYRYFAAVLQRFFAPLTSRLSRLWNYVNARKGTWFRTILFVLSYIVAASFVAVLVYFFLYFTMVPAISVQRPLYFDFSQSQPAALVHFRKDNRFSESSLSSPYVISQGHFYNFRIELTLPESPVNNDAGMFMVTVELYSTTGILLHNSTRPCMLHYKTDLLRKLTTLFWSLPLVLGLTEEAQYFSFNIIENWVDNPITPFGIARVTLSKTNVQVYSSTLYIEAQLYGLSYFCYNWFFTSMTLFIPFIFFMETVVVVFTWLLVRFFAKQTADEMEEERRKREAAATKTLKPMPLRLVVERETRKRIAKGKEKEGEERDVRKRTPMLPGSESEEEEEKDREEAEGVMVERDGYESDTEEEGGEATIQPTEQQQEEREREAKAATSPTDSLEDIEEGEEDEDEEEEVEEEEEEEDKEEERQQELERLAAGVGTFSDAEDDRK
ncbi:Berardinelli-Seip congenital lipodystrophy 2 (seipin) [Balamuthia mandrillaris]